MGLLRLLLAAAVVAEHSTPIFGLSFTGGHLAVRLFFIISGFYMALILTTKYTADHPNRYWLFISNRFLRIYPCYYVVLFLSLAFYAAASFYLHHPADRLVLWQTAWQHGQIWGLFFVSLCQLTVVGMDAVCVFVYNIAQGIHLPGADTAAADVAWLPTAGANPSGLVPAWRFMFVPQSWSISIELLFYLVVPLADFLADQKFGHAGRLESRVLFRQLPFCVSGPGRSAGLLLFPVSSVSVHSRDAGLPPLGRLPGPGQPPLQNRHGHRPVRRTGRFPVRAGGIPQLRLHRTVVLSLPILFDWTKNSRFQKWVGDLSYPVYICHILVKWGLLGLMGVSKTRVTSPPGWLLLLGAIALAALLLWLVDYPIDRWRQRRVKKFCSASPGPAAAT